MKAFADDGNEHIHGHCGPDLHLHGVFRRAIELPDAQMLLDPFEEQFNLPPGLVQLANDPGCRTEQVGQEDEGLARIRIPEANPAQVVGVVLAAVEARQCHGLTADDALVPIARSGVDPPGPGIGFCAGDKERAGQVEGEQALEVEIGTIHHIDRPRFVHDEIQGVGIVQFAVGNMNEIRDVPAQVQQCMHLHGRLGAPEQRPWIQGKAQVDGGGVECIDGVGQIHSRIIVDVQLASPDDQALGKIGKDSPVSSFVGIGQGGSPDGGTDTHVVQPGRLGEEAGLDIAQAFPVGQLSEREDAEMFGRGKRPDSMVSTIATDDTGEGGPGQVIPSTGRTALCRCTCRGLQKICSG